MPYYRTCPLCGAHLDPGEVCDCGAAKPNIRRFTKMLNSCTNPRVMYNALSAPGSAGLLDKERAAQGATNTQDGGVEQSLTDAASASNDT